MAVPSNTTTASKIDRAEVMRTAWAHVKGWYQRRGRQFKFIKSDFAWALHCAWHDARMALVSETERWIDRLERALALLPFGNYSARDRAAEQAMLAELASLKA